MSNAVDRLKRRKEGVGPTYNPLAALDMKIERSDNQVIFVKSKDLLDFSGHTFKARPHSDAYILALAESIRENGILEPLEVRPHPQFAGKYEIIAGHTRRRLGVEAGLSEFPCIAKDLDDDEAVVHMGETNIQRPDWLPSEKAATYKAHLDALKRLELKKAGRPKLVGTENPGTRCPDYSEERLRDIAAQRWGIRGRMLDIYIKLNDLTPEMLQLVDEGRINVKGGYQLAFLSPAVQSDLYQLLITHPDVKVNEPKATDLRRVEQSKWRRVLGIEKAPQERGTTWKIPPLPANRIRASKDQLADPEFMIAAINEYVDRQAATKA